MTTTEKSTNQTVIPVMHPSLQGLIHESVGRGWISYEEINSALPDEFLSPGKIDELLVLLSALSIELIGEDRRMRCGCRRWLRLYSDLFKAQPALVRANAQAGSDQRFS